MIVLLEKYKKDNFHLVEIHCNHSHGNDEKCIHIYSGSPHFERLGVDWRIIIKYKNMEFGGWIRFIWLSPGNGPLVSVKRQRFIDDLIGY